MFKYGKINFISKRLKWEFIKKTHPYLCIRNGVYITDWINKRNWNSHILWTKNIMVKAERDEKLRRRSMGKLMTKEKNIVCVSEHYFDKFTIKHLCLDNQWQTSFMKQCSIKNKCKLINDSLSYMPRVELAQSELLWVLFKDPPPHFKTLQTPPTFSNFWKLYHIYLNLMYFVRYDFPS